MNENDKKERYRLYKSGKNWVTTMIVAASTITFCDLVSNHDAELLSLPVAKAFVIPDSFAEFASTATASESVAQTSVATSSTSQSSSQPPFPFEGLDGFEIYIYSHYGYNNPMAKQMVDQHRGIAVRPPSSAIPAISSVASNNSSVATYASEPASSANVMNVTEPAQFSSENNGASLAISSLTTESIANDSISNTNSSNSIANLNSNSSANSSEVTTTNNSLNASTNDNSSSISKNDVMNDKVTNASNNDHNATLINRLNSKQNDIQQKIINNSEIGQSNDQLINLKQLLNHAKLNVERARQHKAKPLAIKAFNTELIRAQKIVIKYQNELNHAVAEFNRVNQFTIQEANNWDSNGSNPNVNDKIVRMKQTLNAAKQKIDNLKNALNSFKSELSNLNIKAKQFTKSFKVNDNKLRRMEKAANKLRRAINKNKSKRNHKRDYDQLLVAYKNKMKSIAILLKSK
ncbi:KxYKxGKxW signal peptide domain-containing protein [Nicoliella spurrieriana]|uniref:KxYKxGKxW signal peptide domain-containing protein n=1 Tax=Nicoliella spurrieriana TaxID=2925830 RepID=A0A976RT80_9LACO|nr:KxYKxGKxW signal peptide domain-containing protein [Nicoliella spurrieriana]UQS87201.1 KxYKxGKxW signal peptide domain-containing protein [Nicoliella spurrieriana]